MKSERYLLKKTMSVTACLHLMEKAPALLAKAGDLLPQSLFLWILLRRNVKAVREQGIVMRQDLILIKGKTL